MSTSISRFFFVPNDYPPPPPPPAPQHVYHTIAAAPTLRYVVVGGLCFGFACAIGYAIGKTSLKKLARALARPPPQEDEDED